MNQAEKDSTVTSPTEGQLQYASFWARLGAFVVDFTILFVLTLALAILSTRADIQIEALFLLASLIRLGYFVGCWLRWGQTPGKRVFRLKVVSADGGPLSLSQAIIRFLVFWLVFFIQDVGFILGLFPIVGLTYYSIATDGERRGFHDRLAGTKVIRTTWSS